MHILFNNKRIGLRHVMRQSSCPPVRYRHSSGTDSCRSVMSAANHKCAAMYLLLLLLIPGYSFAGFADVIATARNYGLADVAANNAQVIERLLRSGWNSSANAVLQEALKQATVQAGIFGAAAAFSPEAIQRYRITDAPLYSPYCHEPAAVPPTEISIQDVECMDIGNISAGGGYNYTDPSLEQTKWYTQFFNMTRPVPSRSGVYFDRGAGNIWMDTYSVPVMSPDNRTLLAVATADIRIVQGNLTANSATAATSAAQHRRHSLHWSWLLLTAVMLALLA